MPFVFQHAVEARPNGNKIVLLKLSWNTTTIIEYNNHAQFHETIPFYSHSKLHVNPENRDTLITFAELAQASYKRNVTSSLTPDGLSVLQGVGWDQVGV